MAKASTLKGKRILFRTATTGEKLLSGVVGEISPTGNYVRVGDDWHPDDHVRVVEELPAIKLPKATVAEAAPPRNSKPGSSVTTPPAASETASDSAPKA